MESSPTTAGAEFRVSVVGPIASAACGVVFLVSAYLLPDGGTLGLAGRVFFWVGYVNLGLAVLNMIPAAPLDGGKVLSSAIWRATGNQAVAQTWAAGAGIVVGMAAITWGVREVRDPGGGSGLLAVSVLILGGFIAYSAYQQLRSAPIYRALEGRTVAEAMAADPPSAPGWATVGEFLRSATPDAAHQAYPVVSPDGRVEGLLTAAAIRAVSPTLWDQLQVRSLAYPLDRLILVRGDDALLSALQRVEGAEVAHALVVSDDGRILGTLDPSALHRALAVANAERRPAGMESAGV
jgi:hypothetical protein